MAVLRQDFQKKKEQSLIQIYTCITILNAFYQIFKVLVPLYLLDKLHMSPLWVINLTWYLDIFASSLILIVVLVSSGRLLYATRYGYLDEHIKHRSYIIVMTLSFVITIPSSIMIIISQIDIDYSVSDTIEWFISSILQLLPPAIYLVTKRTEDCFDCFNRYTHRYSRF